MVRLPWGSMSQHRTRCPSSAKATGRLSVVVVLATPPFWLANAMTLKVAVTGGSASVGDSYACVFAGVRRIPPRLCESAQLSQLRCGAVCAVFDRRLIFVTGKGG